MERKDYNLFVSLLLWALVPSIYLLFRMNIAITNNVDIDILGQMEWFDLIDEVITTSLTVPLYFLLKPSACSRYKSGFAFLVSFGIYFAFVIIISSHVNSISAFMNAEFASQYLFLQTFSLLTGFIGTFIIMLLTLNDEYWTIRTLLLLKIGLLVFFDCVLIQTFADIGASYSEIIANSIIAIVSLAFAIHRKYIGFAIINVSFVKEWAEIGIFCLIQIFFDNFFYAVMVCKMVNAVSESGNYWVANNFIWCWLLVPVSCFVEIIKKNNLENLNMKNTWRHAIGIGVFWIISIPAWPWLISNLMHSNSTSILEILLSLMPFYFTYIVSSIIDGWFISKGKTKYNTFNSLVVNILYYGTIYILFKHGLFEVSIMFLVYMFGFSMVVHLIFSIIFYLYELHRKRNLKAL